MKLPATDKAEKYVGLYVIDFGQHSAVGYTAEEVALLLESEEYGEVKVYKIHRARPDGTMELYGVPRNRFELESGMFFHARDEAGGQRDYRHLMRWYERQSPPCRATLQLVRDGEGRWLVAVIYPAEYEEEMGQWVEESGFRGNGPVEAGISQVGRFRESEVEVLQRQQLWPEESLRARDREELRAARGEAFQR